MRNLSFGALIVLVGFVAALPFRKVPPPGSADADASLATGPSIGLVVTDETFSLDPLTSTNSPAAVDTTSPRCSQVASAMPMSRDLPGSRSQVPATRHPQMAARIPSDAVPSPRRDLRLPLTYDDLAVPLVTPGYVDRRFSAVAKTETDGPAIDVPPSRFEPLAVTNAAVEPAWQDAPYRRFDTQPPSILEPTEGSNTASVAVPTTAPAVESVVESIVTAKPAIEGRLASDTRPASSETAGDDRPRHWIRQPSE